MIQRYGKLSIEVDLDNIKYWKEDAINQCKQYGMGSLYGWSKYTGVDFYNEVNRLIELIQSVVLTTDITQYLKLTKSGYFFLNRSMVIARSNLVLPKGEGDTEVLCLLLETVETSSCFYSNDFLVPDKSTAILRLGYKNTHNIEEPIMQLDGSLQRFKSVKTTKSMEMKVGVVYETASKVRYVYLGKFMKSNDEVKYIYIRLTKEVLHRLSSVSLNDFVSSLNGLGTFVAVWTSPKRFANVCNEYYEFSLNTFTLHNSVFERIE